MDEQTNKSLEEVKLMLDTHTTSLEVMGTVLIQMRLEMWEQFGALWASLAHLTEEGTPRQAMESNSKKFFESAAKLKAENDKADTQSLERLFKLGPPDDPKTK